MNNQNKFSCIVLAGGMSRRMGEDKGSMIINGKPMILYILKQLSYEINDAVIVLNNDERIKKYEKILNQYSKKGITNEFDYSIKFVEDEIKNKGPLSGIMTGLKNIETEYGLILPCDSPYISSKFISIMFDTLNKNKKEFNSIIPYHPYFNESKEDNENFQNKIKNSEPLHSIYNKNEVKIIKKLLNENKLNVKSLMKKIPNNYFINIDKKLDKSNFRNINRKEDLKQYTEKNNKKLL